jgi:hypothetical protein
MRGMAVRRVRGGWWISVAPVHPWRRAAVAIGVLAALMIVSQFLVR